MADRSVARPTFDIERGLIARGYQLIAGIDEAGRGPLAGPVAAACVILGPHFEIGDLNDSKKLSEKRREALYQRITEQAFCYRIAMVGCEEIDRINIRQATRRAMLLALRDMSPAPDYVLIDGNDPIDTNLPQRALVGGDAACASIAAASILAKVARDRLMIRMDEQYPGYDFAGHKGYGTATHAGAIRALGPCPIHRRSFLTRILEEGL